MGLLRVPRLNDNKAIGIKYTGIECIYGLYKKNRRSLQIYGFSPCRVISIMLAS
uniref:Transposase n=1 Tax=Staphylococcus aureus TaxID=1280 RepID=D2J9W7_STAAU|nr:putative transposase [Staphylococcus aureus]ACZ69137.1 putative transposase [Staphylococcus aureus]ACZ69222.1 putative transposase [Staphylococcus aureus]ADA80492.1 putative transposase [Staphylococcus aureus]ADA80539.1 putative transposase [Staphylococcus aureus]